MEQETKYSITNKETSDRIWADILEGMYGDPQNAETVPLNAAYYDTKDLSLKAKGIAIRTRCEGMVCFATIKWGGGDVISGLHEHNEINIPVDTDSCFTAPPVEMFKEEINGETLSQILKGEELEPIFLTEVERRRTMISFGESIMEIAIDCGRVVAGEKSSPISEIEIELYNGKLEDVLDLTDVIATKYELTPENRSKYARAMELIK